MTTSRELVRRASAVVVCSLVVLATSTLHAQSAAQAESEFRLGKAAMKEGRTADACEHFEASQRLEANVATLMSLADCHDKVGKLASAWGAFTSVVSQTRNLADKVQLHDLAKKRAASLETRLSYLTINVPDDSRVDGLVIRRNGEEVDPTVWNRSVPVDGGDHQIEGKAPGHEAWSTTVTVGAELDRQSVEVPQFKALPELVDGPTKIERTTVVVSEPSMFTSRRKLAIGVAAGGVVAVVVGSVLGFQGQTLRDDAESACPPDACSPDGAARANDLNDQAQGRELGANLGLGIGVAAISAGVVLWLLGAPEERAAERDDSEGGVEQEARRFRITPVIAPDRLGLGAEVRF